MAAVHRRICGNDRPLARSQASPRRSPRPNKPLPLILLSSLPEAGAWADMRWPPWSSKSNNDDQRQQNTTSESSSSLSTPTPQSPSSFLGWSDFIEPKTIIPTILLTSGILLGVRLHRSYLRRIPDAPSISPSWLRRRTIFGKVTSVGDGDNFRIYHTPGGRLAGWGWLPWKRVPTTKKELKDKTIHIRLAGIDAPELAHFGRPEQPFARDAHAWLTSYLLGRRIRASIHRQDQYNRVVGSVSVRRAFDFPPFRRRDVSYEMLKRGLATVYEAKIGAEFGGPANEKKYRKAEWWARKRYKGLWKDYKRIGSDWESPRAYKTRMGMGDVDNSGKSK